MDANIQYQPFTDMTIEEFLPHVIAGLVMDEELTVTSATVVAANMLGTTLDELVGMKASDFPSLNATYAWMPWHKAGDSGEMMLRTLNTARRAGVHHEYINLVTKGRMVYPATMSCHWRPTDRTYVFWINFFDPFCCPDAEGGQLGPVAIGPDGEIVGNRGSHISIDDLKLMQDYCETANVAELAQQYGVTRKAMEYRLTNVAQGYGLKSIGELIKFYAKRHLSTIPQPGNTSAIHNHFPVSDRLRYRHLPRHILPEVQGYRDAIAPAPAVTEEIQSRLAKIKGKAMARALSLGD